MKDIILKSKDGERVSDNQIRLALHQSLKTSIGEKTKKGIKTKVLLIPPDLTRSHAYAGEITAMYYEILHKHSTVDILPALGTHDPMNKQECEEMFGKDIPFERFIVHDWRNDVVSVGKVPSSFVKEISDGLLEYDIDVNINKHIVDGKYDLIISIGQVVPHEVVGMANYSKNILVGCGGKDVIDKTHMLGAVCGMEQAMGKDYSPVRKVLDYGQENFLNKLPIIYVLTVTETKQEKTVPVGVFIGNGRSVFEEGVDLSKQKNFTILDKPAKKIVVYLDPKEFRSTWLGNKAIYRTRMAIADGGELIILAPGVQKFGEDEGIDTLIRKYGYVGSKRVNELSDSNEDLIQNLSAAAHLIHGSSEGRFTIIYAVEHLSEEEIKSVGFEYIPLSKAMEKYNPSNLKDGWNITDEGEEVFFISNPALGLWASRERTT